MDRKKGLIIAIVIAIMLMVGSFAFTRDSEQEDTTGKDNQQQVTPGNDNSGSSEQEDETNNDSQEDEDNSLTVNGDNNSSNTQTGNGNQNGEGNANDEQITDDGYDAAKKAVEAAKESLELNDYKTAEELVGKVTDATKKAELEAELTDIKNSINAIAIVNNLQDKTDSSKNKDDITEAKDYRTETAIIDLVSKLNNAELKDELTAKLENIANILDDTTAPKIEGIGNNEFTKENVNLVISDTNEITKVLTKDGNEIAYLDEITEEGIYVLTVMDKAFNKAEVTFTIDKTKPEFEGLEQSGHYESAIVKVNDNLSPVTITVENRNNPGETYEIENGTELKEEATYHITVTDKAGNSKDLWIAIDKNPPRIEGIDSELTNQKPKITITDKFLTSVIIDDKEYTRNDFEVGSNNENFKFTTTISGEGKHTIVAKDKFGHITSKTFTIDQTPANRVHSTVDFDKNPVYSEKIGETTYYYIKNGASFVFRMRFTEELAENPILNIGNKKVTLEFVEKYLINEGKYIYEATVVINKEDNLADGKLSLILSNVVDKAGNKTEAPVVLDQSETSNGRSVILDNTKPEVDTLRVKGIKDGQGTTNFKYIKLGDTFQVILTTVEELKTLPTLVIDGQEITEVSSSKFDGYYQYIVSYKIPEETKLADGEAIQFILKGYADAAGNPGKELTNEDIKIGNGQTEVFFDKTAPVFEGLTQSGHYENSVTINVTDNLDNVKIVVKNYNDPKNQYEIKNGTELTEEATYYITATDEAGNTSSIWIAIDNAVPTIVGIEDNAYTNENVTLTIKDKFLMTVEIDGKTYTRNDFTSIGANEYFIFEKMIGEEGKHTVIAKDKFGHTTQRTFTIDKTAKGVKYDFDGPFKYAQKHEVGTTVLEENIKEVYYVFTELQKENQVEEQIFSQNKAVNVTNEIKDGRFTAVLENTNGKFYLWTKVVDEAGNVSYTKSSNPYKIDIEEPEVRVLGIAQNRNNPNTNVTNGDSIRIWVYFKEELAVLPKVKLGEKEYPMYHATDSDPYAYILDVVLDDTMKLEQGEIKFKIFGYSDEAGNTKPLKKPLTNENITYTGKNDKLIYDTVKPKPSLIGILNLDNFSTGNVSYAKIGDTVRVRVYFNELLAVEPTITIGGQTYTATLRAGSYSQTYGNAYYADIKLTEDMNLSLGKLEFTVSNYQDKAGNIGETENQDSTNENAYKEVTVLSDNTTSIVNGVSYNNFLDALRAANEDNPVVLVSNIEYSTPTTISKNVKIDLNGYDLKLTNSFLRVNNGGKLSIIGKGTVYSDYKKYAPIDMIGSASPDYEDYATLYVGKDVTLKGNSGILVFQASDTSVGYGVNITVEGTIEAVDIDDSSASFGIYIQGMIKNYTNVPNITLTNTAKIVSDAVGIYAAGYAVWNVNGAYIEGNESGIAIKSGILNVNSGTIKSTGEDQTPTPGFGNGVNPSGTAIQIESNKGYAGNIEINITGGTIESANSAALYEYLDSKTENTTVKNIKISGGRFITNGIKSSIFISPQFVNVFPKFITGGIFSTDVRNYVMEGYNVEKTSNDEFEVVANNN